MFLFKKGLPNLNKKVNAKIKNKKEESYKKWVLHIFIWSLIITASISLLFQVLLKHANLLVSFSILFFTIFIGIIFDTIGIAVISAKQVPFNSMASKKIPGGKIGVKMIKNADKISNFCNDVIGDISSIVSGIVIIFISKKIISYIGESRITENIFVIILSTASSAIIIGGKAICKNISINNSNKIIHIVARIIFYIKRKI